MATESTPNGIRIPLIVDTGLLVLIVVAAFNFGQDLAVLADNQDSTERRLEAQSATSNEDHDTLIRVETEQKRITKDVEEIKGDVKEILEAVR